MTVSGADPAAAVLGRFVAGTPMSAIPGEAIDRAVLGAADYLAVAIPGAGHPMLGPLRSHVLASSAAGRSTVLGSAAGLAAQGAATVNAAAGHALDFDDTHDRLCGHPTTVVLPAALAVRERYPGGPDELAGVEVRLHPRRLGHINRPEPATESQARFSVQYAVAVALRHGDAGPDRFTGEALRDPATRELAARVTVAELAASDQVILPGRDDCFAGVVTVTDRRGRSYSGRVDAPRSFHGDPAERRAAVEEKFGELIGPVFGPSGTAGLLGQLRGLATGEATARSVMGACRAEAVSR